MKLQYSLFLSLPFSLFALELEKPMLRVHCDVNKTIICTDAVQGKGLEETVNGILAEFTFDKWDGNTHQSYYAFATKQLMASHPDLSPATEEFKKARGQLLKGFSSFLEKFPKMLAAYNNDKARMMEILSTEETVIFPSFLKMIGWLNTHYKERFALYLRTFGTDLPEIMPKIEEKTDLEFADLGSFNGRSFSSPKSLRFNNTDALDLFRNSRCNYGIRDDYSYWKSKGFKAEGGKPFPVGLNANEVEIFFDDNADDGVKPIVCPVSSTGQLLDTQELLGKGIIIAVNPKEAILDEDYFIKKVQARLAQP